MNAKKPCPMCELVEQAEHYKVREETLLKKEEDYKRVNGILKEKLEKIQGVFALEGVERAYTAQSEKLAGAVFAPKGFRADGKPRKRKPVRPDVIVTGKKLCGNCDKWKPANASYFASDKGRPTGLQSWCKPCQKEHRKVKPVEEKPELPPQGAKSGVVAIRRKRGPQVKYCGTCRLTKPIGEFYKSNIVKSGYRSNCIRCVSLWGFQWRERQAKKAK